MWTMLSRYPIHADVTPPRARPRRDRAREYAVSTRPTRSWHDAWGGVRGPSSLHSLRGVRSLALLGFEPLRSGAPTRPFHSGHGLCPAASSLSLSHAAAPLSALAPRVLSVSQSPRCHLPYLSA
jgi:hypothetical protein